MARLIEVQNAQACPPLLTVQVGDVILFHALGGHVRSRSSIVELWGPLVTAVLGDNGAILTPMGPPNAVLFRACLVGCASIDVVTGHNLSSPQTHLVEIAVVA